MTHNLSGKAFQYHNITSAMDETFTLPGYISGLIYDPAQVSARFAIKASGLFLQTLAEWWQCCKNSIGLLFHFMTIITHATLTLLPSKNITPLQGLHLNIKTSKSTLCKYTTHRERALATHRTLFHFKYVSKSSLECIKYNSVLKDDNCLYYINMIMIKQWEK